MQPRLLVLGGNGFVGKAMCRAGLRRNWQVTSLSRNGAPNPMPADLSSVNWVQGSALEEKTIQSLGTSHQYTVHSIGILFDAPNGNTCDRLNHQSLSAVLRQVSKTMGIGYISAAQFDPVSSYILRSYYKAKREAEVKLMSWNGGRRVIFRPGVIYGGDRPFSYVPALPTRMMPWFFPKPVQVDHLADRMLDALGTASSKIIYESNEI